jgi:hypothetical protein
MAVQYSPLPEFQLPNVNILGSLAQGQALQQNALQQQRLQQQMDLAERAAGYTANRDLREAEKLQTEERAKAFELASKKYDMLVGMSPRLTPQNYKAWYKEVTTAFPPAASVLNPEYDPEQVKLIPLQAADMKPQLIQQTIGGKTRITRVGPTGSGEVVPGSEMSTEEFEPIKGAGDAIVGYKSKYGRKILGPEEFEAGGDYLDYAKGREGTGKNPLSSAQGTGQFIDSTFVNTYRKAFPDKAQGMSRDQILAQRGVKIDANRTVEDVMLPVLTQENVGALKNAGFQPSKGNVYLSHFLGAPDAIEVLEARPDTPVEELLRPSVLRSNPDVFKKVKTAGDLVRWAGGATPSATEPTKMEPIGTAKRQAQEAALSIIGDIGVDFSGEDRVSKLIMQSTSGPLETAASQIPRTFGGTTAGREAIAKLEPLAAEYSLEKLGGKLGSGVSNADVQFISKTMGDIANPMIPAKERLAAWNEVKRRLAKYANIEAPKLSAAPRGQAGETEKPAERKRIKFTELGD